MIVSWLARLMILVALSHASFALAQKKKAPKGGVPAIVTTSSAIVYAAPDFDAEQISSLPEGRKVFTSAKTYGTTVKFYKIRLGEQFGYISTIDVNRSSRQVKEADRIAKEGKPKKKDRPGEARSPRAPFVFSRYFGIQFGQTAYREDIAGVNADSRLIIYGMKVTGPDIFIEGPLIDFNFTLHMGVPSYYNALAEASPTGVIFWTDLLLLNPILYTTDHASTYIGIGPALIYSSFRVVNGGSVRDLTTLNLGGSLMAGFGFRWGKMATRFEIKQVFEKKQYSSFGMALQIEL